MKESMIKKIDLYKNLKESENIEQRAAHSTGNNTKMNQQTQLSKSLILIDLYIV